jgi:geranylgeranyldiphosphate transferase
MAEDLANGEYSYPILVALYADVEVSMAVEDVLRRCRQGETGRPFGARVSNATMLMQRDRVRARCLRELDELREQNRGFASLWGRKEEMVVDTASLNDGDGNGRVPSKRGFLGKVLYSWYW